MPGTHHHRAMHNHRLRILQLVYIFVQILRVFGLYPYRYDRQTQQPQSSWVWRIYSAFCVTSYIFVFAGFCVYGILRESQQSIDSLMDFVRISEVGMVIVTLLSVIITEQCFYGPCFRVLLKIHRTLKDIFEEFISSSSNSSGIEGTPNHHLNLWWCGQVVGTTWKCLALLVLLLIISASTGYTKCIVVLMYLPTGWNYLALAILIVPFLTLSLSSAKVCVYIHAFDHGFQMLNKQLQITVHELNEANEDRRMTKLQNYNNGHRATWAPPQPHQVMPIEQEQQQLKSSLPPNFLVLCRKQKRLFRFQQSIYRIRSQHDALCLLLEQFFKHWALFLLVFLTMHFSLLVIEAFFLFTNVYTAVRNGQDVDTTYAFLNVRACLMLVLELTWTVGSCSSLMDSIRRTGVTLNAFVLVDKVEGFTGGVAVADAALAQTIETWTIKLLCQPNAVQVFRLFDINNGLLFSVSGTG